MDCFIYENAKCNEAVYDVYSRFLKDRTIFLCEEIDALVSSRIIALLLYLDSRSKTKEIKFYINSYGGTITGFFAIYDVMNYIQAPIRTICIGEACSAAADLLASGTPGRREASENAQIMIHSLQISNVSGSMVSASKDIEYWRSIDKKTVEIMSINTGQSVSKIERDCRLDKYMTAQEALEYGIIDNIISKPRRRRSRK